MASDQPPHKSAMEEEDTGPVSVGRPIEDSADLDITPMIDVTFLLLIFFLVCSTAAMQTSVDLPPAQYGRGVSEKTAVIFTVLPSPGTGPAQVFLGSTSGARLPDDREAQEAAIVEAVEEGLKRGEATVLIKASKEVKYRDVEQVGAAAGLVEGIRLHMAVMEIE
jgi:biopolymer transport protein ExbD